MGWRWRKRVKVAPGVSINLGPGGVGVSAGVRGSRVSVGPTGRVTQTVGIPGTGIYHQQTVSGGKKTPKGQPAGLPPGYQLQPARKGGGCLKWAGGILAGLLGIGFVGALFSDRPPDPGDAPATAIVAATETPAPVDTATAVPIVEAATATLPAATVEPTPASVSGTCDIKGNVNSSGERIYHALGFRDYDKVVIRPEEGDVWFCTEEEAVAAGFRAPENH